MLSLCVQSKQGGTAGRSCAKEYAIGLIIAIGHAVKFSANTNELLLLPPIRMITIDFFARFMKF